MSNYSLTSAPALGGVSFEMGETKLEEVQALSIVSMSLPVGDEKAFASSLKSGFGALVPKPGLISTSKDKNYRFLPMSNDQLFVLFELDGDDGDLKIKEIMGDAAYVTFQSDNWVSLRLMGELAVPALQRICQIDLDEASFPVGAFARSVMEHMGAMILREGKNEFLLMSAWSTAGSFYHALEHSIKNAAIAVK